jgi:hypothetical protein
MNKIYVVNECFSGWENSGCLAIMATFDKNKADAKVAEMETRLKAVVAANEFYAKEERIWEAINPRPDFRKADPKVMHEWYLRQREAMDKVRQSFPQEVKDDISNLATDLYWEVGEIPFEE